MSSSPVLSSEIAPVLATDELPAPIPQGKRTAAIVWFWARVGLAIALLAASGGARAWQARRVDKILRDGRISPFTLTDLPMKLGAWVGEDLPMDPIIAQATGSVEHVQRRYQNTLTGQKVELIFLFGPSTEMFIHAPEVCYPASGYEPVTEPIGRIVTAGPSGKWSFLESIYHKGEGNTADQQEVYHSWRHSNSKEWGPGMITQKGSERIPGLFKVQVARSVKDREISVRDIGNPCQAFLSELMPEIERRIAAGRHPKNP